MTHVGLLLSLLSLAAAFQVACRSDQPGLPLFRVRNPFSGTTPGDVQTATSLVSTSPWTAYDNTVTVAGNVVGTAGMKVSEDVGWVTLQLPLSAGASTTAVLSSMVSAIGSTSVPVEVSLVPTGGFGLWPGESINQRSYGEYTYTTSARTLRSAIETLAGNIRSGATIDWTPSSAGGSFASWQLYINVLRYSRAGSTGTFSNVGYFVTAAIISTSKAFGPALGREAGYFVWRDLGGGNSVAPREYIVQPYCDRFTTVAARPLDILLAVDSSGSMSSKQGAVAALGNTLGSLLGNAGIDWRAGLVTTAHWQQYTNNECYNTQAQGCREVKRSTCRNFTTNTTSLRYWLDNSLAVNQPNSAYTTIPWVGAGSSSSTDPNCWTGTEKGLYSAWIVMTPAVLLSYPWETFAPRSAAAVPPANKLRAGSNVLFIYLGDADDQNAWSVAQAQSAFQTVKNSFAGNLYFAGIICPLADTCGETQNSPRKIRSVLEFFGAQIGSISDTSSIQTTLLAVLNTIVSQSSPYDLSKSNAILASVQVLLDAADISGTCGVVNNELPRNRTNGFDVSNGRISLFGGCRPSSDGRDLVANYFYWVRTVCGDGQTQADTEGGEQCDTGGAVNPCCNSATCQFTNATNVTCPSSSSGGCSARTGNCFGVNCQVDACPIPENYCDIGAGCSGTTCLVNPRVCTPLGCFARICDRTIPNSANSSRLGECVLIPSESGYVCDANICPADACGVCAGDNSSCADCFGIPQGIAQVDLCGVCDGNNDCIGCDGSYQIPPIVNDICGQCGGDGTICTPCNQTTLAGLPGRAGNDACGVCNGDGTSCLPAWIIQVTVPLNGTSQLTCDQLLLQVQSSLQTTFGNLYTGTTTSSGTDGNVSPSQLQCNQITNCIPGADNPFCADPTQYGNFQISIRVDTLAGGFSSYPTSASIATALDTPSGTNPGITTWVEQTTGTASGSVVLEYVAPNLGVTSGAGGGSSNTATGTGTGNTGTGNTGTGTGNTGTGTGNTGTGNTGTGNTGTTTSSTTSPSSTVTSTLTLSGATANSLPTIQATIRDTLTAQGYTNVVVSYEQNAAGGWDITIQATPTPNVSGTWSDNLGQLQAAINPGCPDCSLVVVDTDTDSAPCFAALSFALLLLN